MLLFQDLPGAIDPVKLEKGLGLGELGRGVGWAIKPSCGVTGEGLEEGLHVLQELILKRRKVAGRAPSVGKAKTTNKVKRSHSHHY